MTLTNPGNQYLRWLLVIGTMAVVRNVQKHRGEWSTLSRTGARGRRNAATSTTAPRVEVAESRVGGCLKSEPELHTYRAPKFTTTLRSARRLPAEIAWGPEAILLPYKDIQQSSERKSSLPNNR